MHRGDAVNSMTADSSKMRHADALLAFLADQRHPGEACVIIRKPFADLIKESAVDLIDDLQMTWEQFAEYGQWPGFQRLGKQCMVGEAECLHGDGPRRIPIEPAFIHEEPHQFGNADRG